MTAGSMKMGKLDSASEGHCQREGLSLRRRTVASFLLRLTTLAHILLRWRFLQQFCALYKKNGALAGLLRVGMLHSAPVALLLFAICSHRRI